ncbi:MAG: lasso peptide biosynthesis B2 protein [Acaryochloridaceae cyanobacterium RL_2_7]|nr:lasso peptide biosynthesis B2 protein [Acaryochloridaceae cyanobacterium RL_2_7]
MNRRLLLFRTFILLTGVRLGLALLAFQNLREVLARFSTVSNYTQKHLPRNDVQTQQMVRQVIWAVEKSAQLMPGGAKCLAKALTTQVLMARRSCECEFKIGVAKTEQGALEAHAWIEKDGQVIMGFLPDLDRFQSLPPLQKPSIL